MRIIISVFFVGGITLSSTALCGRHPSACWVGGLSAESCCRDEADSCWKKGWAFEYCCLSALCPENAEVFKTRDGYFLCLRQHEYVDQYIRSYGFWPDIGFLSIADAFLAAAAKSTTCMRPRHFLDVGANIGTFAVHAAMQGWKVIAVEPLLEHIELLNASCKVNNISSDSLHILPAAAVDTPGEVLMWHVHGNSASSTIASSVAEDPKKFQRAQQLTSRVPTQVTKTTIPGMQLDSIMKSIAFMKMDVEGHEGPALTGAEELLSDEIRRPIVVLIEFWPEGMMSKGFNPSVPLWKLVKHGYRLFLFHDDVEEDASLKRLFKFDRKAGLHHNLDELSLGSKAFTSNFSWKLNIPRKARVLNIFALYHKCF